MCLFLKRAATFILVLIVSAASGQEMQMVIQTGHSLPVTDIAFSKDATKMLSTSQGVVKLWDFVNKKELKSISVNRAITSMVVLSDTTAAVVGATDLLILNLRTNAIDHTLTTRQPLNILDYSTSKNLLMIGGPTGIRFLKFDGANLKQVDSISIAGMSGRFSVTGDSLLVTSTTELLVFNTEDKRKISGVPATMAQQLKSGKHGTVVYHDGRKVSLSEVSTGKTLMEAYGDRGSRRFIAADISADKKYIIASNSSKLVYVWTPKGKVVEDRFFDQEIISIEAHPTQPIAMMGASDGRIWTFDFRTSEIREDLKTENQPIASVSFIDDRKSFAVIQGASLRIYDFEGPLQVRDFAGNPGERPASWKGYYTGSVSIGKDTLITSGGDNKLRAWNVATGHNEAIAHGPKSKFFWIATPFIVGYFGSFYNAAFFPLIALPLKARTSLNFVETNPRESILAPGGITGSIRTINTSGFTSQKIKPFNVNTKAISFNNDGTRAAAVGMDIYSGGLKILDLSDVKREKVIWRIKEPGNTGMIAPAMHPEKPEVAVTDGAGSLHYYDYVAGKEMKAVTGIAPVKFAPDKSLFYQLPDFSITSVNSTTFNEQAHFAGHTNIVKTYDFNSERLITGSADGTARLWDLKTGKELATVVSLADNNFIFKTPDNYYYCSKSALKLVSFTKGMKFFPFEQFDLQYNRPDIVLERLGMTSEELIHAYRRAYTKRLKKMNFSEEVFNKDFHLPEVNVRRPAPEVTGRTLDLHVTANDSRYKLDRINIYINNVPLHGNNGIDLKSKNTQHVTQTVPVELSNGKNQVVVTVHNEKGVESLAETFEVNYTSTAARPNLYVLAIGVSNYKQSAMDLTYAAKDARDFATLIAERRSKFSNIIIDTLLNKNATLENILTSAAKLRQSKVDDHVIVFIAGHGLLNNDLDYFVATHDIDFLKPEEKGLAYERLEDLLMAIPARNKVLLMDACHSGEVDKEEVMLVANTEKVEEGEIKFRSVNGKVVPRVGLQNSFELMKHLFADLRRGSGTSVVSSAGGAEYAMEGKEWKNGIFTYCMVSGLKDGKADVNKDGKVMLSELQKYLQTEVPRLTSGKQTPTSRTENLYNDVEIW